MIRYSSAELREFASRTETRDSLVGKTFEADGPSRQAYSHHRDALPRQGVWRVEGQQIHFVLSPFVLPKSDVEWIANFSVPRQVEPQSPQRLRDLTLDIAVAMLDAMPINVMYADASRTLRYMNGRSKATLQTIEHLLPVKADQLLGISIDRMHKDPRRVEGILAQLGNQPHSAVIGVGDERLSLTASAVRNDHGELLGFVAAWSLITQQERLEKESRALTQAVASSSTEISAAIAEIAESVERSAHLTRSVVDHCEKSENQVDQLRESGAKIAKIIEVITDLSDQTNLLSLNATIEAARAGEAGRGFAIVASEVKNLARQTKAAIDNIEDTVTSISEVIDSVASGATEIRSSVDRVSQGTTTIAASLEEQSITVKELSRLAEQVANVSHRNR